MSVVQKHKQINIFCILPNCSKCFLVIITTTQGGVSPFVLSPEKAGVFRSLTEGFSRIPTTEYPDRFLTKSPCQILEITAAEKTNILQTYVFFSLHLRQVGKSSVFIPLLNFSFRCTAEATCGFAADSAADNGHLKQQMPQMFS